MERAEENCILLTNGLGGYASLSAAYSVTRGDQGILVSASQAPNIRQTLVQRMQERLKTDGISYNLSTQRFASGSSLPSECGYRYLTGFVWDEYPGWLYELRGISIQRRMIMKPQSNTTLLSYEISNHTDRDCTLTLEPGFLCAPKGQVLSLEGQTPEKPGGWNGEFLSFHGMRVYLKSEMEIAEIPQRWEELSYCEDALDGRAESGFLMHCLRLRARAAAGEKVTFSLILSDSPIEDSAEEICLAFFRHQDEIRSRCRLQDPLARQLAVSADAYITRKDSTGGQTIVAGYPFFGDWGRDTMIALPGCVLATGRWEEARSILRTFLAFEKDGLVPNLFPEGGDEPRYNTVDAALLLINGVWLYEQARADEEFLQEAYPVMERIIIGYCQGTHHGIGMDKDGLIRAGEGLDQVTWMDVCVQGILPTPRHGKPVEVNAYWYNALRIMGVFAARLGRHQKAVEYDRLAERVRSSFCDSFWMEKKQCLRDVISGTSADEQIRCNQIWAVSLPFTMLSPEQEKAVVDTVYRELYTPCGLRTLSPSDRHFHPHYGGPQLDRDLAYHQGTTWVFPLGAFYRAYLKTRGYSPEARSWVRERLQAIEPMLREGCIGQLPEIYEGLYPSVSKGCFAQAWSVGEILSVYQALETDFTDCIFDLYGTLVDIRTDEEKQSLWYALSREYREFGLRQDPTLLKQEYEQYVEEEIKTLTSFPPAGMEIEHPEIDLTRVFARMLSQGRETVQANDPGVWKFGQRFRELSMEHLALYPGTKELLKELHESGKRVWLLSNAQRVFTAPELEMLGIADCFDGIYLSSDYGVKKPDPEFYRILLQKEGINPKGAVMIGNDGTCDILGARKVGLRTLYMKSQTSPTGERPAADYILERPDMMLVRDILLGEQFRP